VRWSPSTAIIERTEPSGESPIEAARRIAETVAGPAAASVDREARFPSEAFQSLRDARLLSALVPARLGGAGASLAEIAEITETLARRCAATGMIYAMHQIQVACLVNHAQTSPHFGRYLEDLASNERLIASATSEVGVGGDLRQSIAFVDQQGQICRLEKRAPTVSYGAHTDDLLVTARRSNDAAPSDQVLVLLAKGDHLLEPQGGWNTLGMRGTCSPGFVLRASFSPDQIIDTPFSEIACQTMVPVSHLLWSSVWLGIASDALARAHAFVRAAARREPGSSPPGALRLAEAMVELDTLRARVSAARAEYEAEREHPDAAARLSSLSYATKINGLKIAASEQVVEIVTSALRVIGMAGYKEEGDLSVTRHLRDAHAAALMISNDRIYAVNASLLLAQKDSR
jgi:acyl-CoA dehydrogenase